MTDGKMVRLNKKKIVPGLLCLFPRWTYFGTLLVENFLPRFYSTWPCLGMYCVPYTVLPTTKIPSDQLI